MSESRSHDAPVVVVRDARRSFGGHCVFTDVSFEVAAGSCCAIVGANGVGKSTLLQCVTGGDRLDHGTVTVAGAAADESSPTFRRDVAAVVGDIAMFPHLTAHEHLQLVAIGHGVSEPHLHATRVLADVGLTSASDQLPATLSSGQRRRLALASAFVRPRRVLVLDEPEQHLDGAGRRWLAEALCAEKDAGVAVLLVSHDSELVAAVADRIVDGDAWR